MKKNMHTNFKQNNNRKYLNSNKPLSIIQKKNNNSNKNKKFLDVNISSNFTPIKLKENEKNEKQISNKVNNRKISDENFKLNFKLINNCKQRGRNFSNTNIYNENKGTHFISNTSNSVSFTTNFKTESNNQFFTTQFTQITSNEKNILTKSNDNKISKSTDAKNNKNTSNDYEINSNNKKIINQRMEALSEKDKDKYDIVKLIKHKSKDEESLLTSFHFDNNRKINSYSGNDYKKTKTYNPFLTNTKISEKPKNLKLNNNLSRNKNKKLQNNFNYSIGNQSKNKDKEKTLNKSLNLPDGISTLKNICSKILVPMKISYKKKSKNSFDISKNINIIQENIEEVNLQKNIINESKKQINKTKVKNLYILIEQKKESDSNQETIEKLKETNKFIESNIKKLKSETSDINKKIKEFQNKLNETENEISIKNELIKFSLKDRDKAKTMYILLHRRIIDLKKRIEEFDNKKRLFNKSLNEIETKFKKELNLNNE